MRPKLRELLVPLGTALFMISLVISGCDGGAPSVPAGLLASRDAQQTGAAIFAANCATATV